jgi:hypothetical protein
VTLHECSRESDVLDAVASTRWPDRVSPELVAHVATCASCADVAVVAQALRCDQDAAWQEASVPSSGQVWWRAEMRARQDAIRAASRPIAIAHGVGALLALALATTAGWFVWPSIHDYVSSFAVTQSPTLGSPLPLALMVALVALLVIAPLAVYLVLSDE